MQIRNVAPSLLALSLAVAPAIAVADDWTGGYLGLHAGAVADPDDNDDTIRFDTGLDGGFGDTVSTAAGANAFSPGFCDGIAQDRTPAGGCSSNHGGGDYGIRAGYDWQSGSIVYGVLFEYAQVESRDAVSAFSTTPARYTIVRKLDDTLAVRGRIGLVFGDGNNLVYATGGWTRANVDNSFDTSNTVNTFVDRGGGEADGWQAGLGYERRFGERWTVGVEYLMSRLDDDDYLVRAQGPAPATNPFILQNPDGTDFLRSDDDIDLDSLRLTVNWRF